MFSTEREKLDREHVMEIANIEVHGTSSEVKIFEQYLQYWVFFYLFISYIKCCYVKLDWILPISIIAGLISKRTNREIQQQNARQFGHSMIGKADFIFSPIKICWF